MTITEFIETLKSTPTKIDFKDTIEVIDTHYTFTPTSFTNGNCKNEAGQNSGSCKLFFFAKLQQLDQEETLHCFGEYYSGVLDTPEGEDHQNIRNFMKTGWDGISFEGEALVKK